MKLTVSRKSQNPSDFLESKDTYASGCLQCRYLHSLQERNVDLIWSMCYSAWWILVVGAFNLVANAPPLCLGVRLLSRYYVSLTNFNVQRIGFAVEVGDGVGEVTLFRRQHDNLCSAHNSRQ
jgi:hypothetical protein